MLRTVDSATGARLPVLGQGTWMMGVDPARAGDEVRALQLGIDLGMTLVDTAEMYGEGGAERVVAQAIAGRRDEVYLVSKVYPHNASRRGAIEACERSLSRLGTGHLDLYLLHWPGEHPIEDTLAAFEELRAAGKILDHGVSNFDRHEVDEACAAPGGERIAANQILYNPSRRGPERGLIDDCRRRGVVVMAYSPLEQARLRLDTSLARVARRHGVTAAQVALAWSIREPGVCAVVKAAKQEHLRANVAAADLVLTAEDVAEIDREFPVPDHDIPLECI